MSRLCRALAVIAVVVLFASVATATNSSNETDNATGGLVSFPFCQTSQLCKFCWEKQPTVCYSCMTGSFLQGQDCSQNPPYTPSGAAAHVLLGVYAFVALVLIATVTA